MLPAGKQPTPDDLTDDSETSAPGGDGIVLRRHPVPPALAALAALAGLVARITDYRETPRPSALRMIETASLIVPLVIGFGAPFAIAIDRWPWPDERWTSFAAGLTGHPVGIASPGTAHCIQVDFTPFGADRFFGMPMRLITDRMVEIGDFEDRPLIALRERLGAARCWSGRFAMVERFLAPGVTFLQAGAAETVA